MAELVSQTVIEGTLEQVVFQSDDGVFYVLKLRRSEDGGMISVTGPFGRLIPGEVMRVTVDGPSIRATARPSGHWLRAARAGHGQRHREVPGLWGDQRALAR
jgi:hypothetical protein